MSILLGLEYQREKELIAAMIKRCEELNPEATVIRQLDPTHGLLKIRAKHILAFHRDKQNVVEIPYETSKASFMFTGLEVKKKA